MSARSKWSREELEAARRRVRSALQEAAAQPISLGFRGGPAKPAAPPPPDLPAGPALRAAAVMSRFRLDDLRTSDAAEVHRLREQSIPLREEGWRTLEPAVRNAVLRQISGEELRQLLEQHARNDDPLQAALQKARSVLWPDLLQTMSVGELAALLQIHESAILPAIPRDLIERKLQLARLLEPLRQITRTFSGRTAEMQQLRDYVGVLSTGSWLSDATRAVGNFLFKPAPKGPFLIHGPGGVGKTTLTAQFILEHALAAQQQQFPFAYLDFDRPTVNAEEPVTILIEAIRQIGLQYDHAFAASERLGERWRARLVSGADTESFVRDFIGFLETLEVREGPVLFVLDTFEEVQRRSAAYARGVTLLTGRLSVMIPRLRVVIAGRSPLDDGTDLTGQLPLEAFDHDSAVAYLRNSGLDPASAELVAERTHGNPLTLTLAIELYRRDPAELRQLDLARLTDEIIQSLLFDRILLHIPDPEVRRLAHPGLVLRRVTPELIRDVLAKPCGVDAPNLQSAEKLFDKLAADSTLVTHVDPRTLVHRSDVRRLMLKPLREHQPEKVEEIHRAAIELYRRGTDVISRAEAAYHALSLGERVELTPDLEPLLVNALDELAPGAQVQLAEAYRLEIPPETWKSADQESWERAMARKVEELMDIGDVSGAMLVLSARTERSAHTDLLIAEARVYLAPQVYRARQNIAAARTVARRGIKTYRDAGNSTLLFRMLLVAAEIERVSNQLDAAYSYLADAEEIAQRRHDRSMLVQVWTARGNAERYPASTVLTPSKNIPLRSAQREQLRDLLVKHYGGNLAAFLETRYNRGIESVSLSDDAPRTAMDLVRAAERDGWLNDLIIGLWRSRFLSLDVLAYIDALGLGPQVRVAEGKFAVPEKQLRALLSAFRTEIAALEARTCRIVSPLGQRGCGIVVGDQVVMTVPSMIGEDQVFNFDRVTLNGKPIDDGMGRVVRKGKDRNRPTTVRIRINDRLASVPIERARAAPDAALRGVVVLPKVPRISISGPLFCLWRGNDGTFLSGVTVNTDSSLIVESLPALIGAPCFDSALNVVGMVVGPSATEPRASIIAAISE